MKLTRLAFLPLLLFVAGAVSAQDEVETKFTRYVEGEGAEGTHLDVAFATYTSKKTDVKVILYGAVHIADKAYYEKVQSDLSSYDVVLFEGVKPSKDAKPDEKMEAIGELQTTMGKALGLTFQKDGIDYKGGIEKNFVHADMTQDELLKATDGDLSKALPGMNMFNGDMMEQMKPVMGMLKSMGKLPAQLSNPLKKMLAKQLGESDLGAIGGEEAMKILVGERNKVALKRLDEQLEKHKSGTIAIFYGAAHMKDFNEQLEKKGWKQDKVEWNTAWQIGGKRKKADSKDEPKTEEKKKLVPSGDKKRWL